MGIAGYPILRGVAEFYASRAEQASDGTYHISHVEGSDEGQGDVSDSAWVNAVAAFALRAATSYAVAAGVGRAPTNWSVIADGLIASIPFDLVGNKHFPYANFSAHPDGGLDVLLLLYPLSLEMDVAVKKNDLDFYSANFLGPSGMVSGLLSILYKDFGQLDRAATFFADAHSANVNGPYLVWSEGAANQGCPNFITASGLFLQAVWAGYGGLRIREQGLELNYPSTLPNSTALVLHNVAFRGGRLRVGINLTHVSVTLLANGAGSKALIVRSQDSGDHELRLNVPFVAHSNQMFLVVASNSSGPVQ